MNPKTLAEKIIQSVCELQEMPDPDHPETIMISVGDLRTIIDNHVDNGHVWEDATKHVWHERVFSSMKIRCCMNCGFIENGDKPNKPCPGPVSVTVRDSTA